MDAITKDKFNNVVSQMETISKQETPDIQAFLQLDEKAWVLLKGCSTKGEFTECMGRILATHNRMQLAPVN